MDKWLKLLKNNEAHCYIKPTKKIHDSGFNCFEIGYCVVGKDNKIEDKLVLGSYTDSVSVNSMALVHQELNIVLKMDLTIDGYIRLWSSDFSKQIKWTTEQSYSSMELTIIK